MASNRNLDPKYLEGKTIKSVDSKNVNLWIITFTDGEQICLDTHPTAIYGIVGPVIYKE